MNHKNIKEMKKVLVSAIAAVSVGIGLGYVCFNPENNLSDLEFANIEALSGGEAGSQVVSCYCKTKWFSPNVCVRQMRLEHIVVAILVPIMMVTVVK